MYVEPRLRIDSILRSQLEKIEDRLNIGIEAVITLTGECRVTVPEIKDRLLRILIQFPGGCDAFSCRVLAIVTLVVERCCVALVVGWNNACPKNSTLTSPMVDLRDGISLC